ncbi:hypothetical protein RN001_015233 [Aquatica leii]|uniref:Uncharacterized protein n=1 Tax=Aquatica leii TaxID=1421715 RepID=A0AAN7NYY6_9COLE|nr:hypothetical protein RN001_015233 [Aquatica leii]
MSFENNVKIKRTPLSAYIQFISNLIISALNRDRLCFGYLIRKFPGISTEKLKAGIFDGPQIRQLIKDPQFTASMNEIESNAWLENMLSNFNILSCNMTIKVHYLYSHLDRFPENLGEFSKEQGEKFHQDIKTMEDRYQGRWGTHMMADYCWSLQRDCPNNYHARKPYKRKFLNDM